MAWLSASLFLLPVMKLRVVRGMIMVEGGGMGLFNGFGEYVFVGGRERRERRRVGSMIKAASLA